MPTLGVDQFKSKLTGGGARPNLFQVTCNFPGFAGGNSELASFMIKGASLPTSTMGSVEVPFRGRKLKIAGDRTFPEWTIKVINDVPMKLRDAFERWMNGINQHQSNIGRTNPKDYMTDWSVSQLDKSGAVVKQYIFRGVFPTTVGAIDLAYDSNDAIEEFDVTVQYQYWEANSTPSSGGSGASFGISAGVSASVNVGGVSIGGGIGF
jgi:T4-like virus tail tube protein gp19